MNKKLLGIIAGVVAVSAAFSFAVIPAQADNIDLGSLEDLTTAELMQLVISLMGGESTPTTTGATTPAATTTTTSFAGIPAGFTFDKNLSTGMSDVDVKYLQVVLNSDSATAVATTGVGSAGNETEYFGTLTKNAVVKFQDKYASEVLTPLGLTKGTGYVGTTTRAKLNSILAAGSSTTPVTPTTDVASLGAVDCVTQGYAWDGTVCSDPNAEEVDIASLSAIDCVTQGYSWDGTVCYDQNASTPTDPSEGGTTPVVTPVEGAGMTVALASTSPANTTLVTGEANATLAEFVLTNKDSEAAKITNITLNRIGVSADSTLSNVYLFNGEIRLTDSASVNEGVITFNNGAGLFTIPAGSSMTVTVSSDIATGTSGQIVGVSLTGLTSNVELTSTLPIQGGTQSIAAATLADYAFGNMNSAASIDPATDVTVWQTSVTAGTRDVKVSKLALKQISSIERSDVQNFRLYINGEEVAQVDGLDENNMITFTFDYTLKGTKTFKVEADVIGGSGRILQMSLRNAADFTAVDSQYDVPVTISSTSTTSIPASGGALTILEGSAILKKDSTSPTGYISLAATNQLWAKFNLEVYGEDIKIDTLKFKAVDNMDTLVQGLTNGKVLINGTQYGSTASLLKTGTEYTVNYVAKPGETITIEVYADAVTSGGNAIASSDSITISAMAPSSANATRQTSLTTVSVPGADVAANPLTTSTGSMTVAAQSNYGTQSVVFPQSDYKLGAYVITGSAVEAANMYNLALAVTVTDGNSKTQVRNVYAVVNGEKEPAIKTNAVSTTGTYNFSINEELAKNGSAEIEFYADINTTGTPADDANVATTLTVSATGDESGTTVTGGPNAGQTINYTAANINITRAAGSPDAAILPDEGTVKTIGYQIEAQNDSYTIDTITVDFGGTNGDTVVSQVMLKDGSETLQTKPGASSVTFAGLNYVVPANTKKTLDVVVVLSAVGPGQGSTGANIVTTFNTAKVAPSSTGNIAAYAGTAPTSGNNLYVYKSIPTIGLATLPSSTLTAGTKTLSKFTVSADASASIAWKQIVFTVDKAAGPTIGSCNATSCSGVKLYDGSTAINGTMVSDTDFTAADAATGKIKFIPSLEQEISASGSKTYELKATTIGGTIETGDYILASIANPSSHAASARLTSYVTDSTSQTYIAAGASVAAGDVRQSASDSYSAANTGTAATPGTSVLSKFANDSTVAAATFTYTAATISWASAGWTVTNSTAAGFTATNDTTGEVITASGITAADGATVIVTVTKTDDGYASGTAVVASNSDIGLALTAGVPSSASFIWSDMSKQSHSSTTADWANDYLVKSLPTSSQSLTK